MAQKPPKSAPLQKNKSDKDTDIPKKPNQPNPDHWYSDPKFHPEKAE